MSIFDQTRQLLDNLKSKATSVANIIPPVQAYNTIKTIKSSFPTFRQNVVNTMQTPIPQKYQPVAQKFVDFSNRVSDPFSKYVQNMYVASAKDIPIAIQGIKKPTPYQIGGHQTTKGQSRLLNVGRLGIDVLGAIPDPTDLLLVGSQYIKASTYNQRLGIKGKEARQNVTRAMTFENPIGLGTALTSNQGGELVGNIAELPLMLIAGRLKSIKNTDEGVRMISSAVKSKKITIDEGRALLKEFKELKRIRIPRSITKGNLPQKGSSLTISEGGVKLSPSTKGYVDLSSTSIIPEKGKLNVKNLNLPKTGQKIVRASNQIPATVIGNKDVVKSSTLTRGAKGAMSDAQQQELLAKRLNSRQMVVSLTREFEALKKSGADEKTLIAKFNQISDQSRIAQQEGTFAGRQLQAQKILVDELATPQQKVLALLENAGVDKSKYAKDAINVDWNNGAEVVAFYRKYVSPKFSEYLTEFRYTNMLSSPLTHIINTATNIFQSGVIAPIEKTISGGLDWAKSAMTGSERKYYVSDGIDYARGYYKALPQAWSKFKATITGKEINIKPDIERIPTSSGGIWGKYTTPLKALEAADQFLMELVKGGEITSLQKRGLGAVEIAVKAENSAKYRLFRQQFDPDGKLGQGYILRIWDKYNSVINQLRRVPGGNWIVPFLQTPTNILKQGFEYSPLGVTTMIGAKTPIEQLSKSIIGTTVFLTTYGLLDNVEFTWEVPNGQKERNLFYAANMQPYSIKIGNQWVSYSKLGPLSYPIAMAAALRYAEKYKMGTDKENVISTAIGGMLKFFSDQSYVKQLGDFMDSIQTGKGIVGGATMEIANAVGQIIPYRSFLGWLSRMIDPINRKANTFTSSITNQIPGLSMTNEPYYNPVTGAESMRSNRFTNSVSPIRTTTGDLQAESLYKYTGSAKSAYANLKALPREEAAAIFDKIAEDSPAIARGIVNIIKDEQLGLTSSEKTIKALGVESGERAYKIANEFNKLKTPEQKAALWDKYVKSGIITVEVAKQLKILLQK